MDCLSSFAFTWRKRRWIPAGLRLWHWEAFLSVWNCIQIHLPSSDEPQCREASQYFVKDSGQTHRALSTVRIYAYLCDLQRNRFHLNPDALPPNSPDVPSVGFVLWGSCLELPGDVSKKACWTLLGLGTRLYMQLEGVWLATPFPEVKHGTQSITASRYQQVASCFKPAGKSRQPKPNLSLTIWNSTWLWWVAGQESKNVEDNDRESRNAYLLTTRCY